ncbi:MAG TPA: M20/M25/M40 family metallo-hydrolase [Bryobacteraceae bacterium]
MVAELAASAPLRDCLTWFYRERQWIAERHLQLSRIPAPTFFEQRRAEWVAGEFKALGCDAKLDRAGNVLATLDASAPGPYVALTAHLDTVLAPRRDDEIAVSQDGRMHGPGVSDNGAGLSALLAVAAAIKACPDLEERLRNILFVANVGEEGEGNLSGMRYLCRASPQSPKISSFLVLDGPNVDHITTRALASRRYEIIYSGPGGHSWSDYGIANPVHALARAITIFSEQQAVNQASPRSSYNFGVMEGGTSINSIPTEARAKVDLRSESASRLEELVHLLAGCVERSLDVENERAAGRSSSSAGRVTAKLREIGSRPGGELSEDSLFFKTLRAVDAHLGIRAQVECASTDANIPLSLGLPAMSIGAGGLGGGAHTPAEWFHPEGRHVGLQRIVLTLAMAASAV